MSREEGRALQRSVLGSRAVNRARTESARAALSAKPRPCSWQGCHHSPAAAPTAARLECGVPEPRIVLQLDHNGVERAWGRGQGGGRARKSG